MKIIILCTQLEAGGAQRAAIRLGNEFLKENILSENWFLYKKTESYQEIENLNVITDKKPNSLFSYIKLFYKLFRLYKTKKPDAVVAFMHYSNILGLTLAYFAGIKIRIASHRNVSNKDMSATLRFLDSLCAKLNIYTGITAVSESTKNSFTNYSKKTFANIKVIHNGLNFKPSTLSKTLSRDKFNLPTNVPLIGNIGRLSNQKNQAFLISSIANLDNVHLAIVGEGELKQDLIYLTNKLNIENRIHFIGEISSDSIPDFLKSLDIFVMPSLYEGLSNALLEALSAKLPIIASDIDSQRDVLISNTGLKAGLLLPIDNESIWAANIRDILGNQALQIELSENASARSKDFSMDNMTQGFISMLN